MRRILDKTGTQATRTRIESPISTLVVPGVWSRSARWRHARHLREVRGIRLAERGTPQLHHVWRSTVCGRRVTGNQEDGIYKNAASERSAKWHKARRMRLWQQRFSDPDANRCVQCGCQIERRYQRGQPKRYCSVACKQAAFVGTSDQRWPGDHATGTIGAIGELMVSADLLRRGYNVFRSLSPNASCDLAIISGGAATRVEVTKAYRTRSGGLQFNPHERERYDVLALWCVDGSVTYIPSLPAIVSAGPLKYSDEDGRAAGGEGVGAAGIRIA